MMGPGDFSAWLPWLASCRACGRRAVVWTRDAAPDGLAEWPVQLCGTCPTPDRCGDRALGLDAEHGDALIALLVELDVEACS